MGKVSRLDRTIQRLQAENVDLGARIAQLQVALDASKKLYKGALDAASTLAGENRQLKERVAELEQKPKGG